MFPPPAPSTIVRTLKVVRIKISLEKFSYMVEQVRRCQMVVSKNRIFSSSKHSFQSKYVHLIPASFECANIDSVDGWNQVEHGLFFFLKGWACCDSKGYIFFPPQLMNFLEWDHFLPLSPAYRTLVENAQQILWPRVPLWKCILWFRLNTWSHPIPSLVTWAGGLHRVAKGFGRNLQMQFWYSLFEILVLVIWFLVFSFWDWWKICPLISKEPWTMEFQNAFRISSGDKYVHEILNCEAEYLHKIMNFKAICKVSGS